MAYSSFLVETSVWQDGLAFQKKSSQSVYDQVSIPFKEHVVSEQENIAQYMPQQEQQEQSVQHLPSVPQNPMPRVLAPIYAQEVGQQQVQELPSFLADVEDLTPFIVSADSKPGTRLDSALNRVDFKSEKSLIPSGASFSPYNMSEKTAKVREQGERVKRPSTPPAENAKMFTMEKVSRYTDTRAKPAFNVPKAPDTRAAEQAKIQATTPVMANPVAPVNVEAIRSQANSSMGYNKASMPSMSNAQTSAAASWLPEAMTRTLDMYEATNKVNSQKATYDQKI